MYLRSLHPLCVFAACALMLMTALPAGAGEALLQGFTNGVPATSASTPEVAGNSPLTKFSATGRVTLAVAGAPCGGLTCNSGDSCTFITLDGPVATSGSQGLGKSILSACISLDSSASSHNGTGSVCENASGNGTIAGAHGNAVNVSLGGQFCEVPSPSPATEGFFTLNAAYAVTGGAGKFSNAVGEGNFTNSVEVTAGPTFSASAVTLTGTIATH